MSSKSWHQFCGHGENFTSWQNNDFGHCFEQVVVVCPSHAILAMFSAYYIAIAYRSSRAVYCQLPWFVKLRVACAALLALLVIIQVVVTKILGAISVSYADILTSTVVSLCWVVHVVYICRLKYLYWSTWRGASSVVIVYTLTVISLIVQLQTNIRQQSNSSPAHNIVEEVCVYSSGVIQLVYIATLFPKWERVTLVDDVTYRAINEDVDESRTLLGQQGSSSYESIITQGTHVAAAEAGANCVSRLTFHWVQPLMVKGSQKLINSISDIFMLPCRLNTQNIYEKFQFILSSKPEKVVSRSASSSSVNNVPTVQILHGKGRTCNNADTTVKQVTLLQALHRAFGVEYYCLGFLKLLADALGFAGPILLNYLVSYIETKSEPEHNGYIYAAALFLSTFLGALISTQFDYNCQVVGFKLRTAIITTVYHKALSVSSVSVTKFTTGQITNFMSTDTDRIVNFCPSFHAVWSLPFQIAVSLYLLYQQVGLAFLAGLCFAVILVPINRWLAIKIGQLSKAMMEQKDARVKVMNEILFGMRVVKYYAWEDHFEAKINRLRQGELKSLKGRKYLDAVCVYFWATTPVLISILTFTTYSLMGHQLTAAKVFTSLALFLMLISPLNAFPWVINGLMEAWVSLVRVQEFVALRDLDIDQYYSSSAALSQDSVLHMRDAEFTWQDEDSVNTIQKDKGDRTSPAGGDTGQLVESPHTATMRLKNINLHITKGQFVGVIGKVGSGKSSLLCAFLAEMCRVRGHVRVANLDEGFALASQEPWIQHASVRDNIVFGQQYNQRQYERTLEACALLEDLQVLTAGDATEVGENGVTLSGGQKARVALARAAYQNKDVYLLDDPLAAVDAHVAKHLYHKCIMGLLCGKTRILCSHHTKYLVNADLVILMEAGQIVKAGHPSEVLESVDLNLLGDTDDTVAESRDTEVTVGSGVATLVEEEERETGAVKLGVFKVYWRSVGVCLAPSVLVALFVMQASRNINDWWLSYWVSHSEKPGVPVTNTTTPVPGEWLLHQPEDNATMDNMTTAGDDVVFYLTVYGCLAGGNSIFTLFRAFLFAYGGICAAQTLHVDLLKSILKAPISFFDMTPIGRIVNRFSSDIYSIDDALPFIMNTFLAQLYGILGTLVITVYGLPWFAILLVPLAILYYKIQNYYRHTSRELKRLSSVSLSPIYAHFSETITGLTTIRAMREQERFKHENLEKLDANQRAQFAGRAASSWLAFRLQMLGVAMVTGIAFIAVLEHHFQSVNPGLVGLAISYALSVTTLLGGVVNSFAETEKQMVSVERAQQYIDTVPSEHADGMLMPPPYWPIQGSITFHRVRLRYRSGLPYALDKISFEVEQAEKVGIVGRTGSGKSSLFLALFRMVEISSGNICVDGIDLHHLDLKDIRSRFAIIPQDPFLFSGTVRENLDPTGAYSDSELWRVLDKCHLKVVVETMGGLQGDVAERGRHFSMGQRQLVCLARAILTKAKILCIDEATASVDLQTDLLIQQTIRDEFVDSTVLTIAHRIDTIMDSDRVLVMADGKVSEFASPDRLLANPESAFHKLVYGKKVV